MKAYSKIAKYLNEEIPTNQLESVLLHCKGLQIKLFEDVTIHQEGKTFSNGNYNLVDFICKNGDIFPNIHFIVGELYKESSKPQDEQEASIYYKFAADRGHAGACLRLAELYLKQGKTEDAKKISNTLVNIYFDRKMDTSQPLSKEQAQAYQIWLKNTMTSLHMQPDEIIAVQD